MSEPRHAVVLCEGFYDRSFWKGWFAHELGCQSLDPKGALKDPWGKSVGQGQYGFHSRSGATFIRVVPCHGYENIAPKARFYLAGLETERLAHLVINLAAALAA